METGRKISEKPATHPQNVDPESHFPRVLLYIIL